ncbi:hypothetical protein AB6A40_003713 [Gnathostoma spinigerum]|uniref:Uncharacterized protein n=1 Tax=Gnathostoma spinigerum TaxID=75299 RepID=A0ABD6EFW0_9BILA
MIKQLFVLDVFLASTHACFGSGCCGGGGGHGGNCRPCGNNGYGYGNGGYYGGGYNGGNVGYDGGYAGPYSAYDYGSAPYGPIYDAAYKPRYEGAVEPTVLGQIQSYKPQEVGYYEVGLPSPAEQTPLISVTGPQYQSAGGQVQYQSALVGQTGQMTELIPDLQPVPPPGPELVAPLPMNMLVQAPPPNPPRGTEGEPTLTTKDGERGDEARPVASTNGEEDSDDEDFKLRRRLYKQYLRKKLTH